MFDLSGSLDNMLTNLAQTLLSDMTGSTCFTIELTTFSVTNSSCASAAFSPFPFLSSVPCLSTMTVREDTSFPGIWEIIRKIKMIHIASARVGMITSALTDSVDTSPSQITNSPTRSWMLLLSSTTSFGISVSVVKRVVSVRVFTVAM